MTISRFSYPGGSYCDSAPSGEFAVLYPKQFVQTHLGPIQLPGEDVLFLRITTFGGFGMCGQGHESGAAWQWRNGAWSEYGPTNGVSCVMFDKGGGLLIVRPGPDVTSQGYRQLDDAGEPVMGDPTYADKARNIWEYSTLAGVTIGQGGNGGAIVLGLGNPRVAEPGDTRFIRLHVTADLFSIAIVKPGEAVLLWATRDDLAALPLVTPDTPSGGGGGNPGGGGEDKPPDKKPMQLPARGQAIVQALYSQHLDWANSPDDDERRKLARAIAEQLRFELGEEWGWKSAHGNTDRDAPSKDAVAHRRGPFVQGRQLLDIFDLFNGTTRLPNNPAMSGPEDLANQYFIPVDPVNHLGAAPVDPPKPDTALAAQVAALAVRVQALEMADGAQVAAIAGLDSRVAKLEKGGTVPPVGGVPSAKDIIDELVKRLKGLAA